MEGGGELGGVECMGMRGMRGGGELGGVEWMERDEGKGRGWGMGRDGGGGEWGELIIDPTQVLLDLGQDKKTAEWKEMKEELNKAAEQKVIFLSFPCAFLSILASLPNLPSLFLPLPPLSLPLPPLLAPPTSLLAPPTIPIHHSLIRRRKPFCHCLARLVL